ncbi:MAG: transglutaminase domain-containing protein [Planctomycetes bacterium]|nr:transglutaminase domain-containing protein [Planctomycetota bacterium]
MRNSTIKKPILVILLLAIFSGELTAGKSQRLYPTHEELIKFIQNTVKVELLYKIGIEKEVVITPGQMIRLNFEDNPARVKDFIFFYNDEHKTVYIYYRYVGDTEKKYHGVELHLESRKCYRSIYAARGMPLLHLFYELEPKEDKPVVRFRTTMSLSEKDREKIKEIDEVRRYKRARELQAELQAVSELEWDFDEKIQPLNIIMDDPNNPNIVKLRKEYDMERLVSGAKDDYEKLRLITGWVQKQWKHNGNNKPSKSDPLTILKEASEGKSFRCVEYAKVVAGCARSLGMPSRTLALKRSDVENAKSSAGHVVAEVWLNQFNKWVFVDGQWGAIPEANGVPLNAIEFQNAIACELAGLKIRFATERKQKKYLAWIVRYLYYFDFNLDQRFYNAETEEERISGSKGKIMLVPKGANKPKVFQRKYPIKNCTYISNPKAFYPQMNK